MYDTMDASTEQETEDADSAFVEVDPSGRYGRYKKVLGKGAFKTVYWAFDELEGMEVAWNQVKVQEVLQRSENLERLYSEVHLLKTLKHKNVIKFYNSWVDTKNKNINFITEIFTSGTLRQYRQRHKHVGMKAIKNWSRQILRGLLYLHSHDPPIIHRDLKCDNIFVNGSQGEVKIGDLGLAVILRQAHAAHSVIGTPEFMAPELYEEEYNELVDIYSFGMCLLEMITFEYPYSECANAAQIYKKVSSGIKPAALDKVKDPNVRQFVEKCLAVASRRLPARELLMHPFLQSEGEHESMVSVPHPNQLHSCGDDFNELKTILEEPCVGNNIPKGRSVLKCMLPDRKNLEALKLPVQSVEVVNYHCLDNYLETGIVSTSAKQEHSRRSRDFQVKGKRKDSNTIFLRLRIADSRGLVRNIHFPFDIEADTALSVASEMVAELDLSDQDVTTIAEMIDVEIEALVPEWKPGLAFEDTSECCHHTSVEDNYSDIPSDGDNPSGAFVLERFPSGRKYWSQSPMIFAEEVPAEPRPVNTPTRFEGLMNGRFEEPTYHQSGSSSALDQLDEINFSSESECQAEDADDVNKSVHLTSPRHSGPTVFNRKIPAIYQDMEHSHSEVVKSTVVTEVKSQPSNLQVDLQIHEKLRDTGRKNLQTEGAGRASGLNQREFAGQHKTMHECHYGAAFQEGADNMTDPLLEDGRRIAQELENLALQQQHELEALKRRHQQALQDLKNRLCLKGCSMNTPKNSLSATLEMQCKFPVNNSASFSSESKSERLSLNEIAAVSAKINGLHGEGSSSTKILDSGLVDSFRETHHPTSSRESNIPHHDFGMQALAPKRNSIPSSRLGVGVNAKGQEHLPYNSQDGMSTQQLPGGRSKLDGYVVSSALSVSAMNATSRDYFSSKPVHAEMGGKNGTDERKSELSEQAKHMNCREKSKGLSSTLSRTHTVDANSSRKVSVEEFRNMKSKEMENVAVCKDMNIESVKNRSTFGFSSRDEANGLCAASLEKKNSHNHMRQLFSVKSTGPLERSYLADCILSMETSYPELNTSAAEKCVKQDATGLQCESIGNALKASFASSVSASRDVDKLGKRESYIGFYKGGVSLRDKPNSFQGDIKISDQGSTVDSSSNSAKPKSTNKGLEQLKKQQLQKSIAELEAKTLEGLWKSKSAYLVNSSVKRQSASVPHAGRFGSNDSTTRQQATPDIRRV